MGTQAEEVVGDEIVGMAMRMLVGGPWEAGRGGRGGRMLGRVRPSLPLKACDLSREAETQGAWAQGCRENDLLSENPVLGFKGQATV